MSGNDPWHENSRDEHMRPGYNADRQYSSPVSIHFSWTQRNRRTSTASPSSVDDRDGQSDTSSLSTAPSSVSSDPPAAAMNPNTYGYELHCPFEFVDCQLTFRPSEIDAYISHTITHFVDHHPPPKTVCIFCPQTFESSNARDAAWTNRMRHIADHYQHFESFEHARPDFFTIEYMRKKKLISSEDYKWATRGSERPSGCDGLVDFGYKTEEMKRKDARALEERYDLKTEDRQRRRLKSSKGKGKGK